MSEATKWIAVAAVGELSEGGSKEVTYDGNSVALFRQGEEYFAVANQCAHYGAPLCGGLMRNGAVMCPWHGWQFDLQTGECLSAPGCKIDAYQVKIENGEVKVAAED